MRARLIGVAKQTSKKFLTLATTTVMAFSGLGLAAPLFFTGSASAASDTSSIFINEVSPATTTAWVELYNKSSSPVDISGLTINTASNGSDFGSPIPNNTIVPGYGYYVQTGGNNELSNLGDTVELCSGSNCSDSGHSLAYPGGLSSTQSYGRVSNGGSSLSIFNSPTQKGSNDPSAEVSVCASGCDFSDINEAVSNVTDNGKVYVDSGNYEGFTVNGKSGVQILGTNAVIAPTSLINTGVGHKYTSSMKVSVFVVNSSSIMIDGFTVGDGGLSYDAMVLWDASSGTISNSNIAGSTTLANISGAQTGQGIAVDGGTTSLNLDSVNISGFQKNGVDVEDGNANTTGAGNITINVSGGSITGVGDTSAIAQNGVVAYNQGGGDITATVDGTSISNLYYTGGDTTASGILAFGTAKVTSVSNTSFTNVQTYIGNVSGGSATDASTGNTFDGISPASATTSQLATIEKNLYGTTEDSSSKPIYILPNTLIVSTDSSNLGIQSAVNAAPSGDKIYVLPGTYPGNVTVNKALTLQGSDATVGELTISASDVKVDGFTFNNAGNQINVSSPSTLSGLEVTNNVFSGYSGTALTAYDAGNILVKNNTFSNPNANSEAIQLRASSVQGGCSGAEISYNTFTNATNNSGADVNLSCTGSNSANITVKHNTSSGDSGGSSFTAFSGVNGGITISDNTAVTDGSPVFFFGNVSGSASITGNSFSGSSGSAISIHGHEYTTDLANTGNFTITNNNLSGNARSIYVSSTGLSTGLSGTGSLTASGNNFSGNSTDGVENHSTVSIDVNDNWWGNALGPTSSQYSGTVTSWCNSSPTVGSACNSTQTASSGTTSLPSGPISKPTVSGSTAVVTIPSANDVVATASTSSGTVQVTIPAGTTVTADSPSWDGTIQAPTVTSVSLGSSKNVSLAIEVGAGDTSLTFDNAVRLVLPGQAGKSIGFVRNNVFTAITDTCSADSQAAGDSLAAGGNCYINVGSDLVVWTKHFTTFVAYSPASSGSNNSSNSSSNSTPSVKTTSASSSTSENNGGGAGTVQGQSTTASSGQTSSTSIEAPVANASQPKVAAHEAGGIRWYWWVIVALVALAAIGFGVYRYADGTDKN